MNKYYNYKEGTKRKKNVGKLGILKDHDYIINNPKFYDQNVYSQKNIKLPTKYIERDYTFNPYRSYTEVTLEDKIFFDNNENLFNYKKKLENKFKMNTWYPPIEIQHEETNMYRSPIHKFIYIPDVEHGSYNYKGYLYKSSNNHLGKINQGMPFFYNYHNFRLNEKNLNHMLNYNI